MTRAAPLLLALLVACTTTTETPDEPTPAEPGPGPALYYLRRTTLASMDLTTGRRNTLAELPSADAALAPDTTRMVVVEETSPLGSFPEGFRKPALLIGPTEEWAITELGPGRSPRWAPDGSVVAAIARVKGSEECPGVETEGGGCPATEEVVAYDPAAPTAPPETLAGPALGYSLLGWSGETVLALRAPGEAVLGDAELPYPPAELWGASPAGEIFLQVDDDGARFMRVDAQAPSAEIDLGGARLGNGAWSFDGSTVAVVLLDPVGARVSTRLVLIDTESGAVSEVPGGAGAQGQVVWSADSKRFAYVRVDPDEKSRLQAVACTVEPACRPLFSWGQGVTLLGLR
jgi:dipeptidyl aminopeptidase/acylaminoacyl peptidase